MQVSTGACYDIGVRLQTAMSDGHEQKVQCWRRVHQLRTAASVAMEQTIVVGALNSELSGPGADDVRSRS